MMISTKGRYALRVLIDMAEHQTDGYIPLKEIAKRQGISEKYLESIVKLLVKGGVVEGMRGKGGGYRLCKSPDQFTAGYILRLMEGSLAPVSCLGFRQCALRARVGVPHAFALDGAERSHQQVSRPVHAGRSPARGRRVRLCDLILRCAGAMHEKGGVS